MPVDGPKRVFSEEFKRETVRLAQERGNVEETARELGIHSTILHRWKRRLKTMSDREVAFPGHGNPRDPELMRLERENARLKEENEILKKLWVSSPSALREIPVHKSPT